MSVDRRDETDTWLRDAGLDPVDAKISSCGPAHVRIAERDGRRLVVKVGLDARGARCAENEVRAYQFSRTMGLNVVPETWKEVVRGVPASVQVFVRGVERVKQLEIAHWGLVLFDFLAFSCDRQLSRNVIASDGMVWAIDNEHTLEARFIPWMNRHGKDMARDGMQSQFCEECARASDCVDAEISRLALEALPSRRVFRGVLRDVGVGGPAAEDAMIRHAALSRYGSLGRAWTSWKATIGRKK